MKFKNISGGYEVIKVEDSNENERKAEANCWKTFNKSKYGRVRLQ